MGTMKPIPRNNDGMIILRLVDGSTFLARTEEGLVTLMRRHAFTPSTSDHDYMRQFAERVKFFTDFPYRIDSQVLFIRDMIQSGFARRLNAIPKRAKRVISFASETETA